MKRLYRTSRPLLALAALAFLLGDPAGAGANMLSTSEVATASKREEAARSPGRGEGRSSWSLLLLPRHELSFARGLAAALSSARSFVFGLADLGWEPAPSRFPLDGPCRASSRFGVRRHPISGRRKLHRGLDVSADPGTAVYAAGTGVVARAGWLGGYGKIVVIDHGGGIKTRYAHLRRIEVRPGQVVTTRDQIARVGATGRATGPHLHFEVRVEGRPVNPLRFELCAD